MADVQADVPADVPVDAAAADDTPVAALPPGQRLMITKLELENFKSYLGVQSVGPFHKVCLHDMAARLLSLVHLSLF